MIYFRSDYSQGAHPAVMDALMKTNLEHHDGYAEDVHSEHARQMIKDLIGVQDCDVHMMVGGTPTNIVTIASALRPYEAVVAPRTGHIYKHECGGVEASGHKIIPMDPVDGKLTPELIEKAWTEYEDDHTVIPKMAYISDSTETGNCYTKAELVALRKCCDEHDMFLYLDGARLGTALTCAKNDLTIKDIAKLTDAFYIGGTKNGMLMGEAVIILNKEMGNHYRWMIKQNCSMLAKGRLIGVQFEAILEGGENSLYFALAKETNRLADMLRDGIAAAGYEFNGTSYTNEIFPIFTNEMVKKLEKDFFFYDWEEYDADHRVIRLVTGWGSTEDDVNAFLKAIAK
ncbi:MAG TPA: beta-eliminating lyase-related protein [Anaerovoracaceae bacterium]|nr:beta-eliminating lyase-related protein [Anaerovoracaceae bacterium]